MAILAIRYWDGNDSQHEAFLASIMVQKEGPPNWRWVGRDFRRIFRKSMANRWGLAVPDFRTLIAAKNVSFVGHLGRSDIWVEMVPKMRNI